MYCNSSLHPLRRVFLRLKLDPRSKIDTVYTYSIFMLVKIVGGKDSNYQIVYRGEALPRFVPGGWVFFQRPKECGGGYWLGRTYGDCFWFEFEKPISLGCGLEYLITSRAVEERHMDFDDDFQLTP